MAEGGYNDYSTIQDCRQICSVCLELIREPRSLPCGHRFCALCLIKYIDRCLKTGSADNFPCPLCRAGIHVSNYTLSSDIDDLTKLDLISFSHMCIENESRQNIDVACQPCNRGNESVKGTHFCSDCNECMCTDCFTHHFRNKLTVNHIVTNIEGMEGNVRIYQRDSVNNFDTKCWLHNKKQFKYICNDHNVLCCSKCVIETHRKCNCIQSFSEFSESIKCQKMIKKIKDLLHCNLEDAKDFMAEQQETVISVGDKISTCSNTFAAVENEMHDAISNIIKLTEKTVIEKLNLQKVKSSNAITTLVDLQSRTTKNISVFDQLEKSSKPDHYVAFMMIMLQRLETDRHVISDLCASLKRSNFQVEVEIEPLRTYTNQRLERAFHRLSSDECVLIGHNKNERPKLLTHKTASISAMKILQNGNVIITEKQPSVFILDSNLNVIKRIRLPCQPGGVTQYKPNSVIISLPEQEKIAVLKCDEMKNSKGANVHLVACMGSITCITSETVGYCLLIVVYCKKDSGLWYQNVTSSIDKNFSCISKQYKQVQDICIEVSAKIVYFSQYKVNQITGIDFQGQVKFAFMHQQLHTPIGIYLAKPDILYVCCNGTLQISEITLSKKELKDVICRSEGLKGPIAVAFDSTLTRCLVYDDDHSMELKAFDMKRI